MDIQTKDGILLRNIPDGTPDDVIKARIAKIRGESSPVKEQQAPTNNITSAIAGRVKDASNIGMGALKGASDIGATLLKPVDYALNKTGISDMTNDERRASLKSFFNDNADTDSLSFKGGELAAGIAGTAGVGGALAKPIGMVAPKLAASVASGGFSLGGAGSNAIVNGATRLAGGAINGGVSAGLIDPNSAGTGAALGAAIPAIGKLAGMGGNAINNVIAPFTEKGKNKIIADFLLSKAGNNADDVIRNLETARGNTAGFNPTAGQAANSADLATLERAMKAKNPSLFQDIDQSQRTALANAIRGIGGDDVTRAGLVTARDDGTKALFDAAKAKQVQLTPELESLMQRPSMQDATSTARQLAAESDRTFNPAMMTGEDAQSIKMGLDDAVNSAPMRGIGGNQLGAIRDTRTQYLSQLEQQLPEYLQANKQFAELSKPINQLDVGNSIIDRYIPASQRDMPSPLQLNREQLAKILRDNGDKLAAHTTGFKGATLNNTLRPDQLSAIQNAVKDGQYISQGELLGKGGGSDTFQKLAFNSDMDNAGIIGRAANVAPLSATLNMLKGVRDVAYTGANKQMESKLAEALLNPQQAAQLMKLRKAGGSKNAALAQKLLEQAVTKSVPVMAAQ